MLSTSEEELVIARRVKKVKRAKRVKKEDQQKCHKCNKALRLTNNFVCRCGNNFCVVHRFHDQHNCSFDFKDVSVQRLRQENPQVMNKKVSDF